MIVAGRDPARTGGAAERSRGIQAASQPPSSKTSTNSRAEVFQPTIFDDVLVLLSTSLSLVILSLRHQTGFGRRNQVWGRGLAKKLKKRARD